MLCVKNKNNTGFTLIELLVVISIIGLLSSVVLSSLNSARAKARDAVRMSDLRQMNTVVQLYMSDHNGSPPSSAGLGSGGWVGTDEPAYLNAAFFTTNFVTPGYISKWPIDPTPQASRGNAGYLYLSDGVDYKVLVYASVESGTVPWTNSLARCPASCGSGCLQNSYAIYSPGAACW